MLPPLEPDLLEIFVLVLSPILQVWRVAAIPGLLVCPIHLASVSLQAQMPAMRETKGIVPVIHRRLQNRSCDSIYAASYFSMDRTHTCHVDLPYLTHQRLRVDGVGRRSHKRMQSRQMKTSCLLAGC
jgi:hypothetical protein